MTKDSDFWMIPDEIKQELAELFADFKVLHPDVELDELVKFLENYNKIVRKFEELDDKATKN